jgi:hypothetical protein
MSKKRTRSAVCGPLEVHFAAYRFARRSPRESNEGLSIIMSAIVV